MYLIINTTSWPQSVAKKKIEVGAQDMLVIILLYYETVTEGLPTQ